MAKELTLEERIKLFSKEIRKAIFRVRKLHPNITTDDIYSYQHEVIRMETLFFQEGLTAGTLENMFERMQLKIQEVQLILDTKFAKSETTLKYYEDEARTILGIYMGLATACATMLYALESDELFQYAVRNKNVAKAVSTKGEVSEYGGDEE